jgi:hypothetical protein
MPLGYAIDRAPAEHILQEGKSQTIISRLPATQLAGRNCGKGQRSADGAVAHQDHLKWLTKDFAGGQTLGNSQMLGFPKGTDVRRPRNHCPILRLKHSRHLPCHIACRPPAGLFLHSQAEAAKLNSSTSIAVR